MPDMRELIQSISTERQLYVNPTVEEFSQLIMANDSLQGVQTRDGNLVFWQSVSEDTASALANELIRNSDQLASDGVFDNSFVQLYTDDGRASLNLQCLAVAKELEKPPGSDLYRIMPLRGYA